MINQILYIKLENILENLILNLVIATKLMVYNCKNLVEQSLGLRINLNKHQAS